MNRVLAVSLILALSAAGCAAPAPTPRAAPAATLPPRPTASATAAPTATPPPTAAAQPAPLDEIIAFEMRGAFDFFWEQANTDPASAGFGLVRDRYPGSDGIASIAAVGFGLTAYLIGIDRGYITEAEGYARVNGTLDTLLALDRTEGFYYHFLDLQTGERAWGSEVSSIDTALLLMGVLSAGQYFGGEIGEKARQIYAGVNWPWFLDADRQMFYMAYRPEKGRGFEGHWDFYAEQLMLYVLAAGSETHPVDERPYYTFTRHTARFGEGQPFIHSWFGALFTYQYSQAWIDFRGHTDREGVNWFDNSVAASQAQVDFAAAMERKYKTLGPAAWGLSASDGPDGYNGRYGAPPSGYDNRAHFIDDTLPPYAAIGSLIFVPEAAERALQNYYTLAPLKGPYGFWAAYNLDRDWYAQSVIGIDKGVSLLMLANHANGFVHALMKPNPYLQAGLARLQITAHD